MIAVQPTAKELRGRLVPAAGVPEAVEPVGRVFDRFDGGDQGGGASTEGPRDPSGSSRPASLNR